MSVPDYSDETMQSGIFIFDVFTNTKVLTCYVGYEGANYLVSGLLISNEWRIFVFLAMQRNVYDYAPKPIAAVEVGIKEWMLKNFGAQDAQIKWAFQSRSVTVPDELDKQPL